MDRFDRLVELVTLTGEKGELPITMALASVVPSQQMVGLNLSKTYPIDPFSLWVMFS